MTEYRLKRIYEQANPGDGYRVLVDRLWPRGISKQKAHLDEWCKEVAPTSELRTWFGHQHERFAEFAERYRAELDASGAAEELRRRLADQPVVTLLIAAREPQNDHGAVLLDVLRLRPSS
ncbi:MAG: DUF488 family protein [Brooklawnia sp.]|nr:DUF488 family protein [Brooklawnia sp.]